MLCIIAPEYESADDERQRSATDCADGEAESDEDAAEGDGFPTVETV